MLEIHSDLHSHSIFAGGAGSWKKEDPVIVKRMKKRFFETALYSPLKGINLLGTGDCQFDIWLEFLKSHLEEDGDGIYTFKNKIPEKYQVKDLPVHEDPKYILQTEVIFTGPVPNSPKKKKAHMLLYFPNFSRVEEFRDLLDQLNVSHEKMARPFIVNDTTEEVNTKLHAILDLDPAVESIPAHVLTPEGVYGSNERIEYLSDFFGDSADRINAIETGLSADPTILDMIPELDTRSLISNADAHSSALNRVGREFTTFSVQNFNYNQVIDSIRNQKIVRTAEFHPAEGRYFLTGHREGRAKPATHQKGEYCYFSPNNVPENDLCPVCSKELTVGVFQRAHEISAAQNNGEARKWRNSSERDFITIVPLVEIIAKSIKIKSPNSKTVFKHYLEIMKQVGTEISLWSSTDVQLDKTINTEIRNNILEIKNGNFHFSPLGYDGIYGDLVIGENIDFQDVKVIEKSN